MESPRPVSALLVKECCKEPSNWRSTETLAAFLARHRIPGVEGLDTRALTLHLRKAGAMRGAISTKILEPEELIAEARKMPSMEGRKLTPRVAAKAPYRWDETAGTRGLPVPAALSAGGTYAWPGTHAENPRVVVYDYGIKWNILRKMREYGLDMLIVPPDFTPAQVDAVNPDGIFLSNGPGDPATLTDEIAIIRELAGRYPVAGICLGHQLLALALGGRTEKLKFGHHGVNHPVKNLISGKVEISSQNHGFHVIAEGDLIPTHVNLNDGTLEGFRHRTRPIITVQHHPEAASGPTDCQSFFGSFKDMLMNKSSS